MIWLSVQIILILYSSHFSGLWIQLPTLALGLHFGNICSCIIFASSKVYSDFGPKHIQIDLSGLIWFGWLHMRINMDIWIDWFVWLIDDSAWIQIRFRILDSVHIRMILFYKFFGYLGKNLHIARMEDYIVSTRQLCFAFFMSELIKIALRCAVMMKIRNVWNK